MRVAFTAGLLAVALWVGCGSWPMPKCTAKNPAPFLVTPDGGIPSGTFDGGDAARSSFCAASCSTTNNCYPAVDAGPGTVECQVIVACAL